MASLTTDLKRTWTANCWTCTVPSTRCDRTWSASRNRKAPKRIRSGRARIYTLATRSSKTVCKKGEKKHDILPLSLSQTSPSVCLFVSPSFLQHVRWNADNVNNADNTTHKKTWAKWNKITGQVGTGLTPTWACRTTPSTSFVTWLAREKLASTRTCSRRRCPTFLGARRAARRTGTRTCVELPRWRTKRWVWSRWPSCVCWAKRPTRISPLPASTRPPGTISAPSITIRFPDLKCLSFFALMCFVTSVN